MYIIVFGVVILKFQISVSDPQFPRHIDLQKVGEAIFNNEKFNILKPTAHLVTDHFKDFMLRQGSAHPGDRVFLDKNGFRHAWSGFGDKTKSLRKTDLKHIIFGNVSEKTPESGNDNDNTTTTVEDSKGNENNNQEEENNASGNNETVQNVTEEDTETLDSEETTTTINIPLGAHEINSTEITIEQRLASDKNETGNKVGGRKAKGNTTDKAKDKTDEKAKGKKDANGKTDEKAKGKKDANGKTDEKAKGKKDANGKTDEKAKGKKDANGKTDEKAKGKKDAKGKTDEKAKGKKDAKGKTDEKNKGKKDAKGKTDEKNKGKQDTKAKDKTTPKAKGTTAKPNDNKRIGKERTVATTTFFCPFFGVITMSAFID